MSEILKKFGKYFLLDAVAQGGMAEIYRARMATPDGGARLVAIKRVLPAFSQNQDFVSMFKSEIKTTSGLQHPNIVQLYDFGEQNGQLYISMELVDGRNLRQYLGRSLEMRIKIPVEISSYIIEQSAAGLAYAHALKDKFSGQNLKIVHRDISPQNLLISYDGAVKVIDFGIAKAQSNSEKTQTGIIKGKPSYLSPEQIAGDELDGRSDIFALGIVLWELLVGRKLFGGENDFAIIKLIENCEANVRKPSDLNADVPPELDAIVMKCLKKKRDERYSDGNELQRALHKFLNQKFPDFNPADFGDFARQLFKNEIVSDREKLQKLNDKAEALLSVDSSGNEQKFGKTQDQPGAVPLKSSFVEIELDKKDKSNVRLEGHAAAKEGTKIVGGNGAGQNAFMSSEKLAGGTRSLQYKDKKADSSGGKSRFAAVAALIIGTVGGYWYYENHMAKTPANLVNAENPASKVGTLKIEANVNVGSVIINDKNFEQVTFPYEIPNVPAGTPLRVSVFSNGFVKSDADLTVSANEKKSLRFDLVREGDSGGLAGGGSGLSTAALRLNVLPVDGSKMIVKVNGRDLDPLAPVSSVGIGQEVDLLVSREGFSTYSKKITIAPEMISNGEYVHEVRLEAAKYGYLSIKTEPSAEAIISVDGIEKRLTTPFVQQKIEIGSHKIRIVNELYGIDKMIDVNITDGQTTNLSDLKLLDVTVDKQRIPAGNTN